MLWIILLLSGLVATASARQVKIVNGTPTTTAERPYQAHLEVGILGGLLWNPVCGAAIIDNGWALTAAHCTESYSLFRIIVNKGQSNQASVSVAEVINHQDYYAGNTSDPAIGAYPNDISLLRLSSNNVITATHAIQIAQPTDGEFVGETCEISGWGLTAGNGSASSVLLMTSGEILSDAGCGNLWNTPPRSPYRHEVHICIHDPNSGACNGDSGGPMICRGILAGITSWGASGCNTTMPSVYTRVSNYYSWVDGRTGVGRNVQSKKIPVPTLF